MRVEPLFPYHREAIEAELGQDLSGNLLPLGHLAESGVHCDERARWLGVRRGRERLAALTLCVGRSPEGWAAATPSGDVEGVEAIGRHLRGSRIELILAPRAPADALWRGLGQPPARVWSDHLLCVCERVADGPRLHLRPPREAELERVVHMAAELEREDLGQDPREEDQEAHREDVLRKIREGRVWLGEDAGEVVFKGDVGMQFARGALVGSLWVDPSRRGQGLGAAGVRAMCELLLRRAPRVGLHVAEQNRPARRAYVAAGFEEVAPFRLFLAK